MYKPSIAMWSKNTNLILQELSDQERTHYNQNIERDRQEETLRLKKKIRHINPVTVSSVYFGKRMPMDGYKRMVIQKILVSL